MSINLYSQKGNRKPLKGGQITSYIGDFDTISANNIKLENITVAGLLEDSLFYNVKITDSQIENTIIGSEIPNAGYFTKLQTNNIVTMRGDNPYTTATWDPVTNQFHITSTNGSFKVDGCSYLGNIEICQNTIRAVNPNGDINIAPNNTGTIFAKGQFYNYTTYGNFYTNLASGGAFIIANDNVSLFSSHGSLSVNTFSGGSISSVNGDVSINVDSGVYSKNIVDVANSNGTFVLTTNLSHQLLQGNVVRFQNELYTVGNILNDFQFAIQTNNTSPIFTTSSGGLFTKVYSNNILLNSNNLIKIPQNTQLTFGPTTNNIVASSSGLNINTDNELTLNSKNTRLTDPILTLANYNTPQNDNKDRGIEFKYYDSASNSMKLGWFGYKNTTGKFTFIVNATNNDEIVTGTIGSLELTNLNLNQITVANGGVIDMSCGRILNVNLITGCGNTLTIAGSSNVNINASNTIALSASNNVILPSNVPMQFGTSGSSIIETTDSNLKLGSAKNIVLATLSKGSVMIPVETSLAFDGTTSGNVTIVSNTSNNLVVTSTKTVMSSDVDITGSVYIKDPIITIADTVADTKDRGVEFKWSDGSTSKLGFFGFKKSTNRFVFIKDATNVNEIEYGNYSDAEFNNGFFTNLSLNNGNVAGVQTLSGGQITIQTTSGNVFINPTVGSSILVPYNTNIAFGTTTNAVLSDTSGNLYISAQKSLILPTNTPLNFGSAGMMNIVGSTSNSLYISNSIGNIYLSPQTSSGNVYIPAYNQLVFGGSTTNSIYSDGSQLLLNGYKGINLSSSTVNIDGNVNIVGTLAAINTDFDLNKFILPLGTYQTLDVVSISPVTPSSTSGNITINIASTGYLSVGDKVTLKNTYTNPSIDGTYAITSLNSPTSFQISSANTLSTIITSGSLRTNLTTYQGKDVGIQVNYWSTTGLGDTSLSAGSIAYKTGFFGFRIPSEKWSFYRQATIANDVVTGTLGDIEVDKVFANRLSGFVLEGTMSAGNQYVVGNQFAIGGGKINNTPIGDETPSSGTFTTLHNTYQASFANVALQSTLSYSFERYTLDSNTNPYRSPSNSVIVSLFSVAGVNYTSSSGTMPSTSIPDGTYKVLVCSSVGNGCTHTVYFGSGKLITPNPQNSTDIPTKLVFKRRSQSAQLIFDAVQNAWILLASGAYVQ